MEAAGVAVEAIAALVGDGILERPGLDCPIPAETPVGGAHFLDERVFDAVGGLKAIDVLLKEQFEVAGSLALEEDALREESVAHGVGGGAGLTLGRDGPAGASAIGAGSLNTA